MNARVKNLKLQAKAATMIMAPRNASALECVVATKPLPVRRRSSVGVRSEGRASRILFFGGVRCGVQPLRRRVAWVKSTRSTGFCLLSASSRAEGVQVSRYAYLEMERRARRHSGSILDAQWLKMRSTICLG